MEVLAVAAAVAGILAFVYVLIIGQKSIPEWWRERTAERHSNNDQNQSASLVATSPRLIPHRRAENLDW